MNREFCPGRLPIVGVMGGADQEWEDLSEPLGRGIAEAGWHLLTGGRTGVMQSVARGFVGVRERNGFSLGILPEDAEPNPFVEIPIRTQLNATKEMDTEAFRWSRNHVNIRTADAVVVLPGEGGTLSELRLAVEAQKPTIALLGEMGSIGALRRLAENRLSLDEVSEVPVAIQPEEAILFLKNRLA